MPDVRALSPGLLACLVAATLAVALNGLAPVLSPLLTAILAGLTWRNLVGRPSGWAPGLAVASRILLRGGIVLLGLQVSLVSVVALGPATLALAAAAVAATFTGTVLLGRLLGLGGTQTLLVASGFAICGAAAVAAAEGVVDADDEEIATAVGLVVMFGTLLIPLLPALALLLGLGPATAGLWIGVSTHEVAQVVAAAGLVGGPALTVAVTVKLARVLLLAPVMALLAVLRRRKLAAGRSGDAGGRVRLPPPMPLFVLGFLAAMLLRTTGIVPPLLLAGLGHLQQLLLAAAMFALGLGVDIRSMARIGGRPVWLAGAATALIVAIGLGGAVTIG